MLQCRMRLPGALAALSVFPEAHAALAGAGADALALEVLQREARRADHREQVGAPLVVMLAQSHFCTMGPRG